VRATLDAHALDGLLLATPASVSWITCGGDRVVDMTAALLRRQEACARVGAAFRAATQPDNTAGDVFAVGAATYAAQGYLAVTATSPGRRHRLHVARMDRRAVERGAHRR